MHAVHRRTIDCHVRSRIPGMSTMLPAATRSFSVSYTNCFMCPQRKKSRQVRSGDLVYETVLETEGNLVARVTVTAGTIEDMPGIFEWARQSMVRHGGVLHAYRPMSRIRAAPVNATAVINMLNYLLYKSSLASEIAVRDHMYHNEIYLFSSSLHPVLIWTNSFGTFCILVLSTIPDDW